MAFEFKLPDIGEGVAEGEIVRWFVSEGDTVERDQPMVEVLTDKANVEIPAPRAGTILKILVKEGETVPVETTLVLIGEPGESVSDGGGRERERPARPAEAERPARAKASTADTAGVKGDAEADAAATGTQAASAPAAARAGVREQPKPPRGPVREAPPEPPREERRPRRVSQSDRVLAMPGVRRFAREHGVDLARVEGTGSQGHILLTDVERFLAAQEAAPVAAPAEEREAIAAEEAATALTLAPGALRPVVARRRPEEPEEELLPYRGVRRQIGRRMAQSVFTAPHYTYVEELNADALVALRREAQPLAQERGVKLTYLPFIVKALIPCLRTFPLLNSVLDEEAQQIRLKKRYHIGIATASEEGLIVPVLKDADQLSILEIAREIRRLSEAARDRSITIDELRGSTFTITSLGPLGGLLATPIINFPEVAVLGVHAIKEKPVVKDGEITIGNVMNLSLSFDHRVVDGAVGAEFTRMLVHYLEDPKLLLLDL